MRLFARTFLLSIALMMCASVASAADYYVDINNRTGYTILQVFVSPAKASDWEEDVLGREVLADNDSRRITLSGYNSSVFDIKLVDTDGDTYTFWNVDVARQDITARSSDMD
jgi:hypothetical protein